MALPHNALALANSESLRPLDDLWSMGNSLAQHSILDIMAMNCGQIHRRKCDMCDSMHRIINRLNHVLIQISHPSSPVLRTRSRS